MNFCILCLTSDMNTYKLYISNMKDFIDLLLEGSRHGTIWGTSTQFDVHCVQLGFKWPKKNYTVSITVCSPLIRKQFNVYLLLATGCVSSLRLSVIFPTVAGLILRFKPSASLRPLLTSYQPNHNPRRRNNLLLTYKYSTKANICI